MKARGPNGAQPGGIRNRPRRRTLLAPSLHTDSTACRIAFRHDSCLVHPAGGFPCARHASSPHWSFPAWQVLPPRTPRRVTPARCGSWPTPPVSTSSMPSTAPRRSTPAHGAGLGRRDRLGGHRVQRHARSSFVFAFDDRRCASTARSLRRVNRPGDGRVHRRCRGPRGCDPVEPGAGD